MLGFRKTSNRLKNKATERSRTDSSSLDTGVLVAEGELASVRRGKTLVEKADSACGSVEVSLKSCKRLFVATAEEKRARF